MTVYWLEKKIGGCYIFNTKSVLSKLNCIGLGPFEKYEYNAKFECFDTFAKFLQHLQQFWKTKWSEFYFQYLLEAFHSIYFNFILGLLLYCNAKLLISPSFMLDSFFTENVKNFAWNCSMASIYEIANHPTKLNQVKFVQIIDAHVTNSAEII